MHTIRISIIQFIIIKEGVCSNEVRLTTAACRILLCLYLTLTNHRGIFVNAFIKPIGEKHETILQNVLKVFMTVKKNQVKLSPKCQCLFFK